MAERFRSTAEADGTQIIEQAGGLLWASESDYPLLFNGVLRLDEDEPADHLMDAALSFFGGLERGFTVYVRDCDGVDGELERAAREARFDLVMAHFPVMVRRRPLPAPTLPPGIELERVRDARGASDYNDVVRASYPDIGLPLEAFGDGIPLGHMTLPNTSAFVAYRDEEPVSVAISIVTDVFAGIEWVGTVRSARGVGLGAALTAAAANAGFERGARVAWLEASEMGVPMYRRMGFEDLFAYKLYVGAA
jgi:GNAT superfamily N-acetyltransferase